LSRAHPNLVKRLFELEVPEIYEGIIEVKAIAREPGERTKIAVYSKDDKIDCVGACVGMRGSRVKNIVSELHGEKIDIVRYASDIKEYIQAALSPAEISQMQLIVEDQKANIIVAEDQLSLAIGKFGQNVRLAGKLVGWDLDIFSVEQWEKKSAEDEEEGSEEADQDSEALDGVMPMDDVKASEAVEESEDSGQEDPEGSGEGLEETEEIEDQEEEDSEEEAEDDDQSDEGPEDNTEEQEESEDSEDDVEEDEQQEGNDEEEAEEEGSDEQDKRD